MSASQARLLSITSRMNDVELRSQQISNTKIRLADESEQVATDYTTALNKQKFTLSTYNTSGQQVSVDMNLRTLLASGSNIRLVTSDGKRVMSKSVGVGKNYTSAAGQYSTALNSDWAANSAAKTGQTTAAIARGNSAAEYVLLTKGYPNSFEQAGFDDGYESMVSQGVITRAEITSLQNEFYEMFDSSTVTTNNDTTPSDVVYVDSSLLDDANWLYEAVASGEFMLQNYTAADGWTDTSASSNTQIQIQSDNTDFAKAEAEYNAKTLKINNKEKKLDNELKAMDTEHSALKTEMDSVKSLIKDNVDKTFNLFS